MSTDTTPQAPEAPEHRAGQEETERLAVLTETPPTGRRQALRDLRRQLTDEELASPGVVKLLLDELEEEEGARIEMQGYVDRYHEADKRAAVLEERLRATKAMEIMFGVGVGLGGAIIGLSPSLWANQPMGFIALAIGFLLAVGSAVARIVKG